jgi:putative glutamine amidotransferase
MQKKPIIGITCGEIHNQTEPWSPVAFGQSQTYVNAIIGAGGIPLLLPLSASEDILRPLYDLLDGICFAGGNDLNPKLYNQKPYESVTDYSPLRDTTEQMLLRWTLQDKKPLLAICRGMHLLNVEFGGTLYQDIPVDVPDSLDHNASTKLETLEDLSHKLRIDPHSKLATILGEATIGTNTHHHQAIHKLGATIQATAWAEDTIIEAIEIDGYPFAIGVQAHPESLVDVEPRWALLFASFVKASNSH